MDSLVNQTNTKFTLIKRQSDGTRQTIPVVFESLSQGKFFIEQLKQDSKDYGLSTTCLTKSNTLAEAFLHFENGILCLDDMTPTEEKETFSDVKVQPKIIYSLRQLRRSIHLTQKEFIEHVLKTNMAQSVYCYKESKISVLPLEPIIRERIIQFFHLPRITEFVGRFESEEMDTSRIV